MIKVCDLDCVCLYICGDVFPEVNTWKKVAHVTAVVAEGHVITSMGSIVDTEV